MPNLTPAQIEQYYRIRLDPYKLHPSKGMEYRAMCPLHGGSNASSFWVDLAEGNFFCFSCQEKGSSPYVFEQKMQALELGHVPEHDIIQRKLEQIVGMPFTQRIYTEPLVKDAKGGWNRKYARDFYRYTDEWGKEVCTVWRFVDRQGKKLTPPDHPCVCQTNKDAECEPGCVGGRVWGAAGVRRVLYRLPELIQSIVVFVVEGEKNANDLSRALAAYISKNKGFPVSSTLTVDHVAVTTNIGGSSGWKKEYKYGRYFFGKFVIKLGDNDAPGKMHNIAVCEDVAPYASRVMTLDLPVGDSEDISDYLEKHTVDDFVKLLPNCQDWVLPKSKEITIGKESLEPRRLLIKPSELVAPGDPGGDWLVDRLIQRGMRGLIVAKPKVGKSLFMLDIAISLATQGRVLGLKPYHRPVRVAVISREDGPQLLSDRIKMLATGRNLGMRDVDTNLRVNTEEQSKRFKIDNQGDLEEMAQWLRAEAIEFCIIDVLARLHFGKENSADEMTKVMLKFDELAQLSGSQICVIHHSNAEGEGRGSTAIDGWADYIFRLENDLEDQALKKLSVRSKSSGHIVPKIMRYKQSDDMKESRIELVQ
jgi:KaiC/GvpD/RAD55 family RecA-like ATPase